MNPSLRAAIALHKAAHQYFASVCHFTDGYELGREPTPVERQVWENADKVERDALMILCALPINDRASQKAKAQYLLRFKRRNELDHEHYVAMLHSLTEDVEGAGE